MLMSNHDKKCEALLWANNPNGMCWCHARALAKSLSDTEAALDRETALLTEATRQNADLMAIIDKRDEALGFIPLDKGMDMQDELRATKSRLADAEALLRWAESMTAVASVAYLEKVDRFLRRATVPTTAAHVHKFTMSFQTGDLRCQCGATPNQQPTNPTTDAP